MGTNGHAVTDSLGLIQVSKSDNEASSLKTSMLSLMKASVSSIVISCLTSSMFVLIIASTQKWLNVPDVLAHAQLLPWLPLAVVVYVAGVTCRGYRLKSLVKSESILTVVDATNIVAIGYAANNILPARAGEFLKVGVLSNRTGLPLAQCLAIGLLERIFDGIAIVSIYVIAGVLLPKAGWLVLAHWWACCLLVVSFVCLLLLLQNRNLLFTLASWLCCWLPLSWQAATVRWADEADRALRALRQGRRFARLVMLSLVVWGCEALFFTSLLPCFGLIPNVAQAAMTMAFTNLGIMLPAAPGYVGSYHFFVVTSVNALVSTPGTTGSNCPVALSYAILVHLTYYILTTAWGGCVLLLSGTKAYANMAAIHRASHLEQVPIESRAGRGASPNIVSESETSFSEVSLFWRQLCASFFPADVLQLTEEKLSTVGKDVTLFVMKALCSLPLGLWILLNIGMSGFRCAIVLRHFRRFEKLPSAKRQEITQEWAFDSHYLMRQLFRPVRSLVLFAFFEHPIVKDQLLRDKSETTSAVEPTEMQPISGVSEKTLVENL